MNILIDIIPSSVIIDDKEYKINADFRTSILFEQMMQDNSIEDADKVKMALDLYYDKIPDNIEEAINGIMWFYRGGKNDEIFSGGKGNKSSRRIYDYDFDSEYIYSAFLEQYGIDLQDIEFLHWWKFKAMFKSLKEDVEIVKIMGYRSVNLSEIKDKKEKERYRKLQKVYKIPSSKEVLKENKALEEMLLKGEVPK